MNWLSSNWHWLQLLAVVWIAGWLIESVSALRDMVKEAWIDGGQLVVAEAVLVAAMLMAMWPATAAAKVAGHVIRRRRLDDEVMELGDPR